MEVHAHTHSSRKKWTHYLWEFIMLFLAVFCGFLAENQREHYVEHQREKEFMKTMLEDLRSDTANLNASVNYWLYINKSIDSVTAALGSSLSNTDFRMAYLHLNIALNFFSFDYNDRTISQLKNAGNFRLVRKKEIAQRIIEYDRLNSGPARNIALQYTQFYFNVTKLRDKVFSQDILLPIFNKFEYKVPPVDFYPWIDSAILQHKLPFSPDEQLKDLFEFKNALMAYRKDFSNLDWVYKQLQLQQNALIKLIQEQYHIRESSAH